VSPKSGRAVSREAGAPWADKLFGLPTFLMKEDASPSAEDIASAYRLAGFFLLRDVFEPRGMTLPDSRAAYLALLG
jgi:DNA repair protein RecO (recombination protein O)